MLLKLGKDEQILRSWDYACEKEGKDQNQANLTVTNRRVITTIRNAHKYEYSEVPIESIRRIDASRDKNSGFGLVFVILGAILAIGGAVWAIISKPFQPMTLLPVAIGAVLIIAGIIQMTNQNKGSFYLCFTLSGSEAGKLDIGANSLSTRKKSSQNVSVKIDFNLVDEMLTSLGAIIYNYRAIAKSEGRTIVVGTSAKAAEGTSNGLQKADGGEEEQADG